MGRPRLDNRRGDLKRCSRCGGWLAVDRFHKLTKSSDGLDYWCKSCRRVARLARTAKDKKMWIALRQDTGIVVEVERRKAMLRQEREPKAPQFALSAAAMASDIEARMPPLLRKRRARNMFQFLYEAGSIADMPCPACADSPGWSDALALTVCPICKGFHTVPTPVAAYVREQMRILETGPPPAVVRQGGKHGDSPDYGAENGTVYGRAASRPCRFALLPKGHG